MSDMTPREIVHELDKHIIGQTDAKRAVAIALRNRWRRANVSEEALRHEITPKNILMIGPTGVGKTEIARRLARLAQAPFIKVEATKFTEIGYVGRDVESIIRDLVDNAVKMTRQLEIEKLKTRTQEAAENRILDALLPSAGLTSGEDASPTRQRFRQKLRDGELADKEIEIEVAATQVGVEIMAPPGMEDMSQQLQSLFQNMQQGRLRHRKLRIADAMRLIMEEEAQKMLNDDDIKLRAIAAVEQHGIVFIDEMDKICRRSDYQGSSDVSREGVQRDLLPLVEGCTVSTRHGMVHTDHILFIASGAFHLTKPSDLIAEMQGRFPIRVELSPLSVPDFVRILTEPDASLTTQYRALLATEGVDLDFTACGIERLAQISWEVNERTENIGARRLHTVLERLLESISFEASESAGAHIMLDAAYVDSHLGELARDEDLSRYIL